MATQVRIADPSWINKGLTMRELRVNQGALLIPTSAGGLGRSGLFATGSHPVGPTGPASQKSQVSPCSFAISRSGHGTWLCTNESTIQVDHATPNSVSPRIDVIIGRVYSTDAGDTIPVALTPAPGPNGAQDGIATIEVITGTPSGSPVEPAIPANAVKLRSVRVPAGTSSVLDASAYTAEGATHGPYTAAAGGVLPINNKAERDALPTNARTVIDRRDLGRLERYEPGDGRWHLVAPPVLPAYVGTWPNPQYGNFSYDGSGRAELARLVIPDQQVPVRPSVVAAAEFGPSTGMSGTQPISDTSSRADFAVYVQGSNGFYELDKAVAPASGVCYQRIVTGVANQAETAGFVIILYALKATGGSTQGGITQFNKRFTVSLHAD